MVVSDLAMDSFLDQRMHVGKMKTQIRNVNKIITTRALSRLFCCQLSTRGVPVALWVRATCIDDTAGIREAKQGLSSKTEPIFDGNFRSLYWRISQQLNRIPISDNIELTCRLNGLENTNLAPILSAAKKSLLFMSIFIRAAAKRHTKKIRDYDAHRRQNHWLKVVWVINMYDFKN